MRGLIIREPWISYILEGRKTWEIRSKGTSVRERIALIRGGSGLVVGTAVLTDSRGPFTPGELSKHRDKHCVGEDVLAEFLTKYRGQAHAWVLENVQVLQPPVRYSHPSGAVIWVDLKDLRLPSPEPIEPLPPATEKRSIDGAPTPPRRSKHRFAESFYFRKRDGSFVYPVQVRDSASGAYAFQVLARGSNRKADARSTTDERRLQDWVLNEGLRVRCRPQEGGQVNAYSVGGECTPIIIQDLRAPHATGAMHR